MAQYIDKDALVAEIEKQRQKVWPTNTGQMQVVDVPKDIQQGWLNALRWMEGILNTLEVKEMDLEKEIQDHIKECLDIKFPTTDIELIKKDVAYTARKFFELGLIAQKGE